MRVTLVGKGALAKASKLISEKGATVLYHQRPSGYSPCRVIILEVKNDQAK